MKLLKKCIAEAIGTFVLVFCACGVAAWTCKDAITGVVPTALAFGLVIVAMAYSIGRISGCHINPAVSLGCLLTKRMSGKEFIAYVIAQCVGGFIGALLLFGIFKMAGVPFGVDGSQFGNACNGLVGSGKEVGNYMGAILVEVVLTAIFVYVILNVTDPKHDGVGKKAGLIIGLTLTLVHLVGIGFTGTSVNPARSLATALGALIYNGDTAPMSVVWVFIVAPLLGGALAALMFKLLHKEEK